MTPARLPLFDRVGLAPFLVFRAGFLGERIIPPEVAAGLEGRIKTAPVSTNLIWKPLNTVPVAGENADTLMRLLELLDDIDDVQNVYGNYELSDAEMARLAG